MDGVFMFHFIKKLLIFVLVLSLFLLGTLIADKQYLNKDVLRLHVVANSDSQEDQSIKLRVKDALLDYFESNLSGITDAQAAKEFLSDHLADVQEVANKTLSTLGVTDNAKVSLTREKFGVREYDTFSLPSGMYESLRVEIGEAAGKNWWCVVFPALCSGATGEDFKATAVSSGMSSGLSNTLVEEDGYEIRFFFLDWLGKIENLLSRN